MDSEQAIAYYKVHTKCAPKIGVGVNEEMNEGRMSIIQHWRLSHVVLSPQLDCLTARAKVKEINKWYENNDEHGAIACFRKSHGCRTEKRAFLGNQFANTSRTMAFHSHMIRRSWQSTFSSSCQPTRSFICPSTCPSFCQPTCYIT